MKLLNRQNLSAGFFYALIPTVFLVVRDVQYIVKLLTANESGDSGAGVIVILVLPFLIGLLWVELFQLYGVLVKNRFALISAMVVVSIEWMVVLSTLGDGLAGHNQAIKQLETSWLYPFLGVGLPLLVSLGIYIREYRRLGLSATT